ncbi:ABC transporter ATP-binding protein [Fodinicola feengrottensis]|uniref:ATP-binding cassette domain-containing protein n=1 Tax=Fodinicola feengrottensis TaxID=435914 RepID=A0ABP4VHN0_9ACTN|nr:ATP-binding cassette domain-containing protein [Fodinicola feengrottensis]
MPGKDIRLAGWGWRHPGRKAWAVRGVDLSIQPGERVLLLGASGAGKSTLLRGLAGLLDPEVGDEDGVLQIAGEHPRAAAEPVGYLQQDPESQLVMARCGDDVAFGLENLAVPAREIWPRVDAALSTVGFGYPRDWPTAALSGGEQQRLALAGVLAQRPGLLLLDEPTANVDPEGATSVRKAIDAVLDDTGATLVLIEHRVAESLALVDRVVVLSPSGVLADGRPDDVLSTQGDALTAAGVWVPGAPVRARRSPTSDRVSLLSAASVRVDPSIVDDVSVSLRTAEVTAITGPNGAGKTTLARVLGGLVRPSGGHVEGTPELSGTDRRPPWKWRASDLAGRIGAVFQDPEHQFLTGRVCDELLLRTKDVRRADELLARLRLEKLAAANPFTLSGGEQRRLSVATALVAAPALLILDEPTFGQDRNTWTELVEMLDALRAEGVGIAVVTHDTAFTEALADRVLWMSAGHLEPAE